jgi:hypothetical protein
MSVTLKATCVVFIIQGGFEVAGASQKGLLEGYKVENESKIELLEDTKLVIIYK